ncbi:sterol desaturase [Ranunculus cassubicifolius]
MLYGPLIAKVMYSREWEDAFSGTRWCFHILLICGLRCIVHQLYYSFCAMLFLTRKRLISHRGVDFKQIDKEWDWDNFIILQALLAALACYSFPSIANLPLGNSRGYIIALILHITVSEPLYYCLHKLLHTDHLFKHYHFLHHSSAVPQTFTAGHATLLEHLMLTVVIGIPIVGTTLLGFGSTNLIFLYVLMFDFLRCLGHSHVEVIPHGIYDALPFLRYLLYTPT